MTNPPDDCGAAAGVTNEGEILVCLSEGTSGYQVTLNIETARHLVKVLLLSIDAIENGGWK